MSEWGDTYRELREGEKKRKKANKADSLNKLSKLNIKYSVKHYGNGNCIVNICHNGYKVTFWPSTGKFIIPKFNKKGTDRKGKSFEYLLKSLGIEDCDNTEKVYCPLCAKKEIVSELKVRNSIHGSFYGCSKFPNCRYTKNIELS